MQLLIDSFDSFGSFLAKYSERLVVKEKGAVKHEPPFDDVEAPAHTCSRHTLTIA